MPLAARYSRFGAPSVLSIDSVDVADPRSGKVRISVRAAGLNPADSQTREGHYPSAGGFSFPSGIGRELAGVVDAVGPAVDGVESRFRVGDEVFGTVPIAAIAEVVIANPAFFAHKPAALDWTRAGALALAGQTAFDSVASQHLTAHDTVLVTAAAGGVGVIVSQLALRAGARVIGSAGADNQQFLAGLGVAPVLYGDGLVASVRALAPEGVTVAFDHHGRASVEQAIELGVPRDRINTIAMDPADLGVVRVGRGGAAPATLEHLAALVVSGELVLPVEAVYPLDRVVEAFEHLESGHLRGKVVIEVSARAAGA